jgi:EAL and modified HD-GYP domain-containing signal transduction protein
MADVVMLGRVPVFDDTLAVCAYRMAIGSVGSGTAVSVATSGIIEAAAAVRSDLGALFGDRPVLIPMSPEVVTGLGGWPFAPGQAVVEVRSIDVGFPGLLDACQQLRQSGYGIAVDAGSEFELNPLLTGIASFVSFDVDGGLGDDARAGVQACLAAGARPVARSVDSIQLVEMCQRYGFDLFAGHALSKPAGRVEGALTPSRLTCLELIQVLNDADTSASDIEAIIEREPGLGYRLLHVAGLGSAQGMRRRLESVAEAVVLLGRDLIYNWLILLLLSDVTRGASEQLVISMTRARMQEPGRPGPKGSGRLGLHRRSGLSA